MSHPHPDARVPVSARSADSNEGVEEAGASQRQDETEERGGRFRGAAKLTPAYQDRCASGIAERRRSATSNIGPRGNVVR
jgi:hypothetical protein